METLSLTRESAGPTLHVLPGWLLRDDFGAAGSEHPCFLAACAVNQMELQSLFSI